MKQIAPLLIPVITDVERNIDGVNVVRCSYYSVRSETPLPNWTINVLGISSRMLIIDLEAILVGPPDKDVFNSIEEIDLMYDFVENNEGVFVDINDIWIPTTWFGNINIKQGLVFRIDQEKFTLCWKLRNDYISYDEFELGCKEIEELFIIFSGSETSIFEKWTRKQIEDSKEIYQGSREIYLKKIDQ